MAEFFRERGPNAETQLEISNDNDDGALMFE